MTWRRLMTSLTIAMLALAGAAPEGQAIDYEHLKTAVIVGEPNADNLAPVAAAGLDGVETNAWNVTPQQAAASRAAAEALGLRIHSVLFGWANFNNDDAAAVDGDVANVTTALRAAQAYGADALLLVPCRVGGLAMPEPWNFKATFDPVTGMVSAVADGDNAAYADYIAAQNKAWETSSRAIRRLIPIAEETGVIIALENVWNDLWLDPHLFAAFVKSFQSPWVGAYFDLGNMTRYTYAPAQDWVRALGDSLVKCHVKDFKLNPNGQGGDWADPLDGSVNWPEVRRALAEVNYLDWLTIEGSGGLGLPETQRRLALIGAGGE
ncbi:MAG TPA: hypothetical protein DCZ72_09500 [Armatimonadetes bacterium]|nr:hypothetical protein [Armatimonadota bacterium]